MGISTTINRFLGERLAASGRMAVVETTGRRSGQARRTPVGFAKGPGGEVWIGAGRAESHWPRNLLANPGCRVRIGREEHSYRAEELTGSEREHALAAIHAKYGERAARVGTGPVFVLRPALSLAGGIEAGQSAVA
ncbi:MAG: nitroreductase family deazaflavin-dependent oxidoreductase [Chloroflexota bacterium]